VSRIEGIEQFLEKLQRFEDDVAASIEPLIEVEVRAMQQEMAQLVPVDTGRGRDAILDPATVRWEESPDGPGKRIVWGLDPPQIAKRAFHLFWVEFGTKGYAAGEERFAGRLRRDAGWQYARRGEAAGSDSGYEYREVVTKTGKRRIQRRKISRTKTRTMGRAAPPRPAQPWFRPARANVFRRLETKLNIARIVQAAKRAAGFADQS